MSELKIVNSIKAKNIFLIMSLMFVIYKRKSKISKNVKINKIRMLLKSRVGKSK